MPMGSSSSSKSSRSTSSSSKSSRSRAPALGEDVCNEGTRQLELVQGRRERSFASAGAAAAAAEAAEAATAAAAALSACALTRLSSMSSPRGCSKPWWHLECCLMATALLHASTASECCGCVMPTCSHFTAGPKPDTLDPAVTVQVDPSSRHTVWVEHELRRGQLLASTKAGGCSSA